METSDIRYLKSTSSTNDHLSELCKKENLREFFTIVTEEQSAGKGQRGNSWESEKGKNLLLSLLLYPTFLEAKEQFYISMLIAIAVAKALNEYTKDISIKWPNDIYWKEKKIAGILIENELEGRAIKQSIVGIGLNVNQEKFVSSAPNPVSLKQIIGRDIDTQHLLNIIRNRIIENYNFVKRHFSASKTSLYDDYIDILFRRNGYHPFQDKNGVFEARFHHIMPSGHLCLEDEDGHIRQYAFKEINYIL